MTVPGFTAEKAVLRSGALYESPALSCQAENEVVAALASGGRDRVIPQTCTSTYQRIGPPDYKTNEIRFGETTATCTGPTLGDAKRRAIMTWVRALNPTGDRGVHRLFPFDCSCRRVTRGIFACRCTSGGFYTQRR